MISLLVLQIIKTLELNVSYLKSNVFSVLIVFELLFLQSVLGRSPCIKQLILSHSMWVTA